MFCIADQSLLTWGGGTIASFAIVKNMWSSNLKRKVVTYICLKWKRQAKSCEMSCVLYSLYLCS